MLHHSFCGSGVQHSLPASSAPGCLVSLHSTCQLGLEPHLKAWLEKNLLQAPWLFIALTCWLLTRCPHNSLPLGSSQYGSMFHQSQQEKESVGKMEVTISCNMFMEVKSHHLCYNLSIRSYRPHWHASEGDTQEHEYQEEGIIMDHHRVRLL